MGLSQLDKNGDAMPHLSTAGSGASIGGAIGNSPTDGSVLFVGAGGVLAQDNANFFYDDTDNQLVMGAGTVGKPSLIFTDDTTGLYRQGANTIGVSVSGVLHTVFGGTGPDSDQTWTMGRALIDSRSTDVAFFSHRDMTTTSQFAVRQSAAGATIINSVGTTNFANSGANIWSLDSTSIQPANSDNARDLGAIAVRLRRMYLGEYWEGTEQTAPAAPGADKGRLYFVDNGAGKTQLAVIFNTGVAQIIATQP